MGMVMECTQMRMCREFIFICFLSFFHISAEKLDNVKICAVADPKSKPGHVTKFCDLLGKSKKSPVTCVYGNDRLQCLRMVSNRDADFTVLNPEDLYSSMLWDESDILVVGEVRSIRDMPYKYGNVVVVRKGINLNGVDMRGKKLCHPGLKSGSKWNDLFAQYLEERLAPRNCEPNITVFEDRAKTSANFFGDSCKAGPWTEDKDEDERMKLEFSNMCSICEMGDCSNSEKYRGSAGSLICLTDGVGDVLWARYDDVKTYFKKFGDDGNVSPLDYSFLCEDGTLRALDVSDPCVWLAMPWQVVASNRKSANEVQIIFHDFGNGEWQENLIQVIESYLHFIVNVDVPKTPEDFLKGVAGYLSAVETSQGNCKPKHSVRLCTISPIEQNKCVWASRAALSVALEPTLECVEERNMLNCLESVSNGTSDIVVVPPDYVMDATAKYGLTSLYYEIPNQVNDGYLSSAVVRENSNIKILSDLKGKKACFTRVSGVGWNSALDGLKKEGWISSSCHGKHSLLTFFGEVCVFRNDGYEDVTLCCNATDFTEKDETKELDCLIERGCDVVFLNGRTLQKIEVKMRENLRRIGILGNYTWYWTYPNFLMINSHVNSVKLQEVSSLFSQMSQVFGRKSKNDNKIFELFADFDGVKNVIFKDTSVSFAKIGPWLYSNDYEEVMYHLSICAGCSVVRVHYSCVITLFLIYILVNYF